MNVYCNSNIVLVLNTTFNNISVIRWRSVLLVEETEVPGKKTHRPSARHRQTLSHYVVLSNPRHEFTTIVYCKKYIDGVNYIVRKISKSTRRSTQKSRLLILK